MKEDKTLLQEGTIRRFMKLAGTQPLATDFVNENYPAYKDDEEPREEADVDEYRAGEEEGEEREAEELEGGDELEMDLGLDVEEEAPEHEGEVTLTDEEVETLLAALDAATELADKLRGAGVEAPEELEVAEVPEEEVDMEAELTGEPLDVGVEEDELEELEETGAEDTGASEDDDSETDPDKKDYTWRKNEAVVKEVYKRVAARLSKLKGE